MAGYRDGVRVLEATLGADGSISVSLHLPDADEPVTAMIEPCWATVRMAGG